MLTVEFSSRCKCSKISRRELLSNSRFRLMPKMSKWVIYNQSCNFHRKHDDNHLGNEGSHLQTHVFFHPTVGWSWSGSLRLEFTVCSSYFQGVNWVNCCFNYGKKTPFGVLFKSFFNSFCLFTACSQPKVNTLHFLLLPSLLHPLPTSDRIPRAARGTRKPVLAYWSWVAQS